MTSYSIEPRTRKYVKGYGFLSFARDLSEKYGKKLLHTARKTELHAVKSDFKKVIYKTTEATGELIGNKISEKIGKPKPVPSENSRNIEEFVIPTQKRQEILNKLRQTL